MKVIILILLLLNIGFTKDGIWLQVKHSKTVYKDIKRVIPKRVCKEIRSKHHQKIVKKCRNFDRVVYDRDLYGYENSLKFKSNGKKYEFNFFTKKKVFEVKLGILDYR